MCCGCMALSYWDSGGELDADPGYESRQMTSEARGGIQCLTHTHVLWLYEHVLNSHKVTPFKKKYRLRSYLFLGLFLLLEVFYLEIGISITLKEYKSILIKYLHHLWHCSKPCCRAAKRLKEKQEKAH